MATPRARRTFFDMRAEARAYLRDQSATSPYYSDEVLRQLFNVAMNKWVMLLSDMNEGWLTEEVVITPVANQRNYTLPEAAGQQFGRVARVLLRWNHGQSNMRERELMRDELIGGGVAHGGTFGAGLPTYRLRGNELILEPAPTTVPANFKIVLETELSVDTPFGDADTLDVRLPVELEDVLVLETVVSAMAIEDAQGSEDAQYQNHLRGLYQQVAAAFIQWAERRSSGRVQSRPGRMGV